MPVEDLRQERVGVGSKSPVVDEHQPHGTTTRFYGRVEQRAGQIGGAERVIARLL
jgi:hypothetical protein